MSDQFLGEIRLVGFNFAPYGWAQCNGQILPINQYAALFSLLGTNFGGNGQSNFGLPNLQASTPLCFGDGPGLTSRTMGETYGEYNVTLINSEMPSHTHVPNAAASTGDQMGPQNADWAQLPGSRQGSPPAYTSTLTVTNMNVMAVTVAGSNFPHNNLSPYLVMNYVIALSGIFPSRG